MTQEQVDRLVGCLFAADMANGMKLAASISGMRVCSLDKTSDGYQLNLESFIEAVMEMGGNIAVAPFHSLKYDHLLSSEFAGLSIFAICAADDLVALKMRHPHLFGEQE